MRWTALYLRCRRVPSALAAVLVSGVAVWLLATWFPDPTVGAELPPLALALGAAVATGGLAGADPALERTAAIDWRTRRLAHVLVVAAVVVAVFQAVQTVGGTQLIPVPAAVRDAAGLTGLAALGVAVAGASLAWLFPVVWCAAAMMTPPSGNTAVQVVAWLLQPTGTIAATVTAIVLGAGGALGYAVLGPRRTEVRSAST
jgi:hypothetical protein